MKERPILFSSDMVRAILEGRKTQTRRVIKPQPYLDRSEGSLHDYDFFCWDKSKDVCQPSDMLVHCPHGQVGDQLWVRETWRMNGNEHDYAMMDKSRVYYRADESWNKAPKWKPSIFMPRWASRIQLDIAKVRVERLQDISEDDACAEGIMPIAPGYEDIMYSQPNADGKLTVTREPIEAFKTLWDSINAKRGYSWNSNPWVWVVDFQVLESTQ